MNVNQVAMGAKPDPYNFVLKEIEIVNDNTIILANYPGSVTFGGDKLMLLRGVQIINYCLDPHFLNEDYPVVARFIPNADGWRMARLCANTL
jgi:hypothetical protein